MNKATLDSAPPLGLVFALSYSGRTLRSNSYFTPMGDAMKLGTRDRLDHRSSSSLTQAGDLPGFFERAPSRSCRGLATLNAHRRRACRPRVLSLEACGRGLSEKHATPSTSPHPKPITNADTRARSAFGFQGVVRQRGFPDAAAVGSSHARCASRKHGRFQFLAEDLNISLPRTLPFERPISGRRCGCLPGNNRFIIVHKVLKVGRALMRFGGSCSRNSCRCRSKDIPRKP